MTRRSLCAGTLALAACPVLAASPVLAGSPVLAASPGASSAPTPVLNGEQSRCFRDWMTLLVHAQLARGPTPRWTQRDCAGLVRFSVAEALRPHDLPWRRANGFLGARVPPDIDLDSTALARLRQQWRRADGTRGAYAPAIDLVQENTHRVSRDLSQARGGDLLFFDMGDDQHLMVWMGPYIAYHTGRLVPGDNGLRALRPAQLLAWNDTRWRPSPANANFAGIYRFDFLT